MTSGVSKSWCFTLNNYNDSDEQALRQLDCTHVVVGREVSSTGTPHLQGFVTFKKAMRLSALKKINSRAHWEVCRSKEASAKYCKKDGDYYESRPSCKSVEPIRSDIPLIDFDPNMSHNQLMLSIMAL